MIRSANELKSVNVGNKEGKIKETGQCSLNMYDKTDNNGNGSTSNRGLRFPGKVNGNTEITSEVRSSTNVGKKNVRNNGENELYGYGGPVGTLEVAQEIQPELD